MDAVLRGGFFLVIFKILIKCKELTLLQNFIIRGNSELNQRFGFCIQKTGLGFNKFTKITSTPIFLTP